MVHPTHIITTETYRSTCVDIVYHDDFIEITTLCASKPTVPTLIPMLRERGVVTVTNNGCTAVCQENMPGSECDVNCGTDFSTHIMLATPKLSAVPALEKRGFTTTDGDCTAVCWDLTPGTGCDVQCRENGITKMPAPTSDVKPLWTTTLIVDGCTAVCQDLNPGSECGFLCPDAYPFQAPGKVRRFLLIMHFRVTFQLPVVFFSAFQPLRLLTTELPVPTKVARAAMIEARAGYQGMGSTDICSLS